MAFQGSIPVDWAQYGVAFVLGLLLVVAVLVDAFGTIVLPRSVKRPFRLSFLYFYGGWIVYRRVSKSRNNRLRSGFLSAYAPASLLILVVLWVAALTLGFGLIHVGRQTPLSVPEETGHLASYMYLSGTTLLTLGYGDLTPADTGGRFLAVCEATTGFIFLALIIGYVPVLYGPFAKREQTMLRLDARAGGDPTGLELLLRHRDCLDQLVPFLQQWEEFASALLEAYLSYPILAYYRSQHDEQSWLKSMTAVMDACAIIAVSRNPAPALRLQGHATFAMGRHLLVDLAYIFDAPPEGDGRLSDEGYERLRTMLKGIMELPESPKALADERHSYEPFVAALARDLALDAPAWVLERHGLDNWQTSAWDGEHF